MFALVLPLVLAIVLSELAGGRMDVKALAMLGVLAAVGTILRPLSAGTAGFELIFFLMILAGRVFGAGFGFALGAITLFTSALITVRRRARGCPTRCSRGLRRPVRRLAAPGDRDAPSCCCSPATGWCRRSPYGWLMDFSFWPFAIGDGTQLSFDPAASARWRTCTASSCSTSPRRWAGTWAGRSPTPC